MAGGSSELMEWVSISLMRFVGVSRKGMIVHGLMSIKSLLVRFMLIFKQFERLVHSQLLLSSIFCNTSRDLDKFMCETNNYFKSNFEKFL
jgi:hypothetical protein